MNNDGLELIKRTIADLESKQVQLPPQVRPTAQGQLLQSFSGSPQESPTEIAKLQSALLFVNPDTGRGHGSFFYASGHSETDIWLAGVWAIASLGWKSGKGIAKNWSQQCPARYRGSRSADTARFPP